MNDLEKKGMRAAVVETAQNLRGCAETQERHWTVQEVDTDKLSEAQVHSRNTKIAVAYAYRDSATEVEKLLELL